jgi:hypothetical protein
MSHPFITEALGREKQERLRSDAARRSLAPGRSRGRAIDRNGHARTARLLARLARLLRRAPLSTRACDPAGA